MARKYKTIGPSDNKGKPPTREVAGSTGQNPDTPNKNKAEPDAKNDGEKK